MQSKHALLENLKISTDFRLPCSMERPDHANQYYWSVILYHCGRLCSAASNAYLPGASGG